MLVQGFIKKSYFRVRPENMDKPEGDESEEEAPIEFKVIIIV